MAPKAGDGAVTTVVRSTSWQAQPERQTDRQIHGVSTQRAKQAFVGQNQDET